MKGADWQWNEIQQIGTKFRDVDAENREMLGALGLPTGAAILEIGCGTARFARAATSTGMAVTAIDVSSRLLEYLEQRVHAERLPHIARSILVS